MPNYLAVKSLVETIIIEWKDRILKLQSGINDKNKELTKSYVKASEK